MKCNSLEIDPDIRSKDAKNDSTKEIHNNASPKDTGWAWMCVLATFLVLLMAVSIAHKCFGFLFIRLEQVFQSSSQETAWISSLAQGLSLGLGPVAGVLATKFTPRVVVFSGGVTMFCGFVLCTLAPNIYFLYFSYGIIIGFGTALCYTPAISAMSMHFDKRLSLANGLAASGSGIGTFVAPPLITVLLEEYSLYGTLLIMGALMLNICVCAALLRPPEVYTIRKVRRTSSRINATYGTISDNELTDSKQESIIRSVNTETHLIEKVITEDKQYVGPRSFEWTLIKEPFLITYCISVFLLHSGVPSIFLFIPSLAQERGLSSISSGFMFSMLGVGDTFGRFAAGWLADSNSLPKNIFYAACAFLSGICACLMPVLSESYVSFGALSFFFGLGNGAIFALLPVILAKNMGPEKLQSSFSILTVFLGVPILYSPAIGGYLADTTGHWNATFFLDGMAIVLSAVTVLCYIIVSKLKRRNHCLNT